MLRDQVMMVLQFLMRGHHKLECDAKSNRSTKAHNKGSDAAQQVQKALEM